MKPQTRQRLAVALVALGILRVAGYLIGSDLLDGVGFATAAAPLPLVFSHYRGMEPLATRTEFLFVLDDRTVVRAALGPELFERLGGPQNRVNAYGIPLEFGPALTTRRERALRDSSLAHGFCRRGPLSMALQLPRPVRRVSVVTYSTAVGRNDVWTMEVFCDR